MFDELKKIEFCMWDAWPTFAEEKVEGPATVLVFLGIQLDSMKMEMWLPPGKCPASRRMADLTKCLLLLLIGHLAQAAKVVIPGRTIVRMRHILTPLALSEL